MHVIRKLGRVVASMVITTVAACDPGADLQSLPPAPANAEYKLSTGDQIRIITFGEQTLSGQFSVDDSGAVALPLLGSVHADGLTARALAQEISGELVSRKLLADPSVVVEVAAYRPIFVLGEVQRPGQYPYQPHLNFLSAVALAGGFTPRAVRTHASVVRSEETTSIEGKIERNGAIAPGDVVTVLERNF